jgi:hypothetical protein
MRILPQPKKISGIRYKDSGRFLLIMETLIRRNPLILINWIQKRSSNPKLVKLLTNWKQDQDNTTTSNPDLPT